MDYINDLYRRMFERENPGIDYSVNILCYDDFLHESDNALRFIESMKKYPSIKVPDHIMDILINSRLFVYSENKRIYKQRSLNGDIIEEMIDSTSIKKIKKNKFVETLKSYSELDMIFFIDNIFCSDVDDSVYVLKVSELLFMDINHIGRKRYLKLNDVFGDEDGDKDNDNLIK